MIEVENLTKTFKIYKKYEGFTGAIRAFFSTEYTLKTAVDQLSFQLPSGELLGYIGVNGAGKSTTIKMLTGIMHPTAGRCLVNGIEPQKQRKKYTKNIGVVFGQRSQLWWDLPVSESLRILRKIYDVPKSVHQHNLDFCKELLGLDEFYLTPVRNLSLGQKMRADLAAALLHDPKVLFLDEPTIGLDLLVKERIRHAIKQINREKGTTVVLTTHDLDDIQEICNHLIIIDQGCKIYDGTLNDLTGAFGQYRQIRFDVKENRHLDLNQALQIQEPGLFAQESPGEVLVKFRHSQISVPEIINLIVNRYDVRDIVIKEPELADIVKEIYSKGEAA